MRDRNDVLLVSGASVQVIYDYATGASVPIAPKLRRRIEAYEGEVPASSVS